MEHHDKLNVSVIWTTVCSCFSSRRNQQSSDKTHILVDQKIDFRSASKRQSKPLLL